MEKGTVEPDRDGAARPHPPLRAEPVAYGYTRRRPRSPGQTFRGVLFAISAGIALLLGFMTIGTSALMVGGQRRGWLEALAASLLFGVPAIAVGVRWGWDALRELGAVRRR